MLARWGLAARATTVVCVSSGAQAAQTSSMFQTRPTVGSWRRMSVTAPAHWVRVSGWASQPVEPQWHQALARTVAAFA